MTYPPVFYLILLVLIGLVMPVMGVVNGNKTQEMLIRSPELRTSIYLQTIIMLLVLAGLVLLALFVHQVSLSEIGVGFLLELKPLIILIISCLLFLLTLNLIKPGAALLSKLEKSYHRVMFIVPSDRKQYTWSIFLSFAAGFCEEIIYRGFLFGQVSTYLPLVPSLLLTNIIFGLCHWGTGVKNALWSFGLGMIWSLIYLWTGSLWLAILTHVMIDLMSMTIGYLIKQRHKVISEVVSHVDTNQ